MGFQFCWVRVVVGERYFVPNYTIYEYKERDGVNELLE